MVKRRLLAALSALLLAGLGAGLLITYVQAADQRAVAGLDPVEVLVASSVIPEGTSAEALSGMVTQKSLPASAVAGGTVSNLQEISGRVAATDLQPGEQLLASRFVDPATRTDSNEVEIPAGLQQVSVQLERSRMLGSMLTPGATVGVFVSLAKEGAAPAQTLLILDKVLVTKVGEGNPTPAEEGAEAEASAPTETVMVTLAVSALDAEKVVFGAEHARLWLSLQPSDVDTTGTRVITAENVNQ